MDTTKQKQAEPGLSRVNRALRMLSQCNQALVRAKDEARLLEKVCQIITYISPSEELLTGYTAEEALALGLEDILKAGIRARDLVKHILAFSRQQEEEKGSVYVSPILKESLKMLRSSLPTTIEIRQDIEPDTGAILGDPGQIQQVIMNLCTNAAYAMREKGGILEISLSSVTLDKDFTAPEPELEPGPYLKLTITDTGHGISPEIQRRIFDPFFSTKTKHQGTGMGLSVVHGIVKELGGMISFSSELEKGSTFHVYLPVIQTEAGSEDEKATQAPAGNERILFVDDEKPVTQTMGRPLRNLGYQVVTRNSSLKALELFRADPGEFDLVITDMTMPSMTGDELAEKVMEIRGDIPVILCTGFNEKITEEKAKAKGIRAFLMKPIMTDKMAAKIREILDQK